MDANILWNKYVVYCYDTYCTPLLTMEELVKIFKRTTPVTYWDELRAEHEKKLFSEEVCVSCERRISPCTTRKDMPRCTCPLPNMGDDYDEQR